MANEQNLRMGHDGHQLSAEEAQKGGINSGKARRRKKLIKENINLLLSLPIKSSKTREQLRALGIDDNEMNNQMALIISIYNKALKGDVNAFNTIADRSGEVIMQKIETSEVPIIKDDI